MLLLLKDTQATIVCYGPSWTLWSAMRALREEVQSSIGILGIPYKDIEIQ